MHVRPVGWQLPRLAGIPFYRVGHIFPFATPKDRHEKVILIPQHLSMVDDGRIFQRNNQVVVVVNDTISAFPYQLFPLVTVQVNIGQRSRIELVTVFIYPVDIGQRSVFQITETIFTASAHTKQKAQLELFFGQIRKLLGKKIRSTAGCHVSRIFHIIAFSRFKPQIPRTYTDKQVFSFPQAVKTLMGYINTSTSEIPEYSSLIVFFFRPRNLFIRIVTHKESIYHNRSGFLNKRQ